MPPAVAKLYEAVRELEEMYPHRKFTPDGHLLGSIGEILAEEALKLKLLAMSAPVHDAVCSERGDVQIKITAGRSIGLRHPCEHLIVFRIISPKEAEIAYDGPGEPAWESAGPKQSNGQRGIGLKRLAGLAGI